MQIRIHYETESRFSQIEYSLAYIDLVTARHMIADAEHRDCTRYRMIFTC